MSTKEKILQAAFLLLSDHGYSGTSMRGIAKIVGIRESAIYRHYKSKEDLVRDIFNIIRNSEGSENLLTDELLDLLDKPKEFLISFTDSLLYHWCSENQQRIFRIVIFEQLRDCNFNVTIEDLIRDMNKLWTMIFSNMIDYKVIKNSDPGILANEFISQLFFIRLKYLVSGGNKNLMTAKSEINNHINFFTESIKR